MAIKVQQFNQIAGMNRDISPSKRPANLAYEIKNMRCTLQDNNSTLLSWENEKGTARIRILDESNMEIPLPGKILGQCVLNDQVILFLKGDKDFIYKLVYLDKTTFKAEKYYEGDLNFKYDSKFETLGVYEKETVQKVYWIDGVNQPRFLNLQKKPRENNDFQFDFIPTDTATTTVKIERLDATGHFKAGTIQYMFTYFNRYGAQTNIFYQSPVYYISYNGIGAEVDKYIPCAFKITIPQEQLNTDFEYLRIYSVSRTSADTTPQAAIVKDVRIIENQNIVITDYNENITGIDYNELLFLNNSPTVATTMDQKDNTLFLGNLSQLEQDELSLRTILRKNQSNLCNTEYITFRHVLLNAEDANQYYIYTNQLDKSADRILGFKGGEYYLFGISFQDIHDRWSSIYPLWNVQNTLYPKIEFNKETNSYEVYIVKAEINKGLLGVLQNLIGDKGYKACKFVIVSKSAEQRNILCQGIVNPTVYCYEDRLNHTAPYAQASWFFRPMMKHAPQFYKELQDNFDIQSNNGGILEFRHYAPLGGNWNTPIEATNAEIQSMDYSLDNMVNIDLLHQKYKDQVQSETLYKRQEERHNFGVDQSIVTFNSPDIEFNQGLQHILDRRKDLKFRIIGYAKLKNTLSHYDTQLEQNTFLSKGKDCLYRTQVNLNQMKQGILPNIPAASLINTWGVKTSQFKVEDNTDATGNHSYSMLYPWNRQSSVNEQSTPIQGDTDQNWQWTAPLKTKVTSNLRFCEETVYTPDRIWDPNNGITELQMFQDNTKMLRFGDTSSEQKIYYGDIDTLLTCSNYSSPRAIYSTIDTQDTIYDDALFQAIIKGTILPKDFYQYSDSRFYSHTFNFLDFLKFNKDSKSFFQDPIRMKYKSGIHAVFGFNQQGEQQVILPSLSREASPISYYNVSPEWDNAVEGESEEVLTRFRVYDIINASQEHSDFLYVGTIGYYVQQFGKYCVEHFPTGKYYCLLRITENTSNLQDFMIYPYQEEGKNYYMCGIVGVNVKEDRTYELLGDLGFRPSHINTEEGEYRRINHTSNTKNETWAVYEYVPSNTQQNPSDDYQGNDIIGNKQFISNIYDSGGNDGIFYIGELYQPEIGKLPEDEHSLSSYNWQTASVQVSLRENQDIELFGDTYFQRYDCLKTYPWTDEDPNQIIDIASFMCETYVNIDGRYDRNRGLMDNTSVSHTTFNMMNQAYTQNDRQTLTYLQKEQIDTNVFPNTLTWTLTKTFGEEIDSWTHLTNTAILDLDGNKGRLEKILNWRNQLLFFQEGAFGVIKYNENAALASSTGVPIELSNSGKVDGKQYVNDIIGCQNKDTIVVSKTSLYFIDGHTNTIYVLGASEDGSPKALSDNSFDSFLEQVRYDNAKSFYNQDKNEIYFTFREGPFNLPCLTYNEQTQSFTSFYDYKPDFLFNMKEECYHLMNGDNAGIWGQNMGEYNYFYNEYSELTPIEKSTKYSPFHISVVSNGEQKDAVTDKTFNTVEFRADSQIMEEGNKGYYGVVRETQNGDINHFSPALPFTQLLARNEYQYGMLNLAMTRQYGLGPSVHNPSSLKRKFRIWRANFPRAIYNVNEMDLPDFTEVVSDILTPESKIELERERPLQESRDRIRNPWTYVTLKNHVANINRTTLHDIAIYYFE